MANKRRKESPGDLSDDEGEPTIADLYKLMLKQGGELTKLNESARNHQSELARMNDTLEVNMKEISIIKADTTKLKTDVSVINSDVHMLR